MKEKGILTDDDLEFVSGGMLDNLFAEVKNTFTMDTTAVRCSCCGYPNMWEDEFDETVYHCPRCYATVTGVVHTKEVYDLSGNKIS